MRPTENGLPIAFSRRNWGNLEGGGGKEPLSHPKRIKIPKYQILKAKDANPFNATTPKRRPIT